MPDPQTTTRPVECPLLFVVMLCAACVAPFLNKAFSVDDPLFLWAASQINQSPMDFYGFPVNWYGITQPMSDVTKNPPLWCYALALFGWVSMSEVWLHLCCWLPAMAVITGTWKLAGLLGAAPATAALLTLSTPVFLVCGTNVMCDVALTAGWVWTIYFWKRGLDTGAAAWLAVACALIAVTALAKYFGIALIPLLAVYTCIHPRRPLRSLAWMIVPVGVLAGYQWWTGRMYGNGLLLDASHYSLATKLQSAAGAMHSGLTALVFLGGCLLSFVCVAPRLWKPRQLLWLVIPALVASLLIGAFPKQFFEELTRQQIPVPTLVVLQAGFYAAVGSLLLVECCAEIRRDHSAESLLLLLWIAGTLLFAGGLNWTISGRTMLPLVPAVSIVVARRLSRRLPSDVPGRASDGSDRAAPLVGYRDVLLFLPGLIVGIAVAWADQQVANSARDAATELAAELKSAPRGFSFQGHWGFQYYMELAGGRAMDFDNFEMVPGDIVVIPVNNTNLSLPPAGVCRQIGERSFAQPWPCSTMSNQTGTGFHSSVWGPVPFAFGRVPPERYLILEVVKPIRRQARKS
jgi:hypothetical protein